MEHPTGSIDGRMGLFNKLLHAGEGKKLKMLESIAPVVGAFEPEMQACSDDDLRRLTFSFREQLDQAKNDDARADHLDDLLPEAFAVVREAGQRTLGQRHFDVQIMGGAALHFGWVAEMKTGEGKTLVATLPVYLNALAGRGVHLVTVNDYLAKFHAVDGEALRLPRLRDGRRAAVHRRLRRQARAYAADITYGTNNEFGFDYLRDNMTTTLEGQVQRGHAFRHRRRSRLHPHRRSPHAAHHLRPRRRRPRALRAVRAIVKNLQRDRDYEVDEAKRTVVPTEEGVERVEATRRHEPLRARQPELRAPDPGRVARQGAVQARRRLRRADGEVKIVDEFTGRILEGRRWSEGLHQAVEAKEGVKIKEENQTLATITLQNYFRMYDKLAGMTGTAYTEAGEFAHTYGLDVVSIPTNRPMVRRPARPHLQERVGEVRGGGRRHRRAPRSRPARCWWARSRSRSRSCSRGCSRSGASPTRC